MRSSYRRLPEIYNAHKNQCANSNSRLCIVFVVPKPSNSDNSVNVRGYQNAFYSLPRKRPSPGIQHLQVSVHIRRGDRVGNVRRSSTWISNVAFLDILRNIRTAFKSSSIDVVLHVQGWKSPALVPDVFVGRFTNFSPPLQELGASFQFGPYDETETIASICESHVLIASISDFSFMAAALCKYTVALVPNSRQFLSNLENTILLEPQGFDKFCFGNQSVRSISQFSFCSKCLAPMLFALNGQD